MSARIKTAYALVDWHNLTGYPRISYGADPRRQLPTVVLQLQQQIAKALNTLGGGDRYRVITRVYHGWHRDMESMPVRRDFEWFNQEGGGAQRLGNVVFGANLHFGNELICDDGRYPIYSTLRDGSQGKAQKMVDTAIVCDCLHLFHHHLADSILIVADDDDFIPAMLTAKSWNAAIVLLRKPDSGISHVTHAPCPNNVYYWSEA